MIQTVSGTVSGSSDGIGGQARMAALVLHPFDKRAKSGHAAERAPEAKLEEALGLAEAIGLAIADACLLPLSSLRPATLLGIGKVEEIAEQIRAAGIGLVIVDADLSPVQQRNLERAWNAKVIDRTALILEIFADRAHTKEGELQVELAHLTYQRSRLVRSWTHLERQRGGLGFVGGPGETQIEADRRLIGERIARIRRQLESVTKTRALHRRQRERAPYPVVALVGYTNAGKSTLFNALTKSHVVAEDMLFATLDPTMRGVELASGRKIILSDTVGFISDLPTHLVAAFRATLEEVVSADLIVHVRDAAHPDSEAQRADVLAVLHDLGIEPGKTGAPPILEAMNKIDLMDEGARRALANRAARDDRLIPVSALTGKGLDILDRRIDAILGAQDEILDIDLGPGEGKALSWLHRNGEVLVEASDAAGNIHLRVRLDPVAWGRFVKRTGRAAAPDLESAWRQAE